MKRVATVIFYVVGAVAVAYLALYAYAMFTRRDLQPGAPIRIFRKPDAPSYSAARQSLALRIQKDAGYSSLSPCGRGKELHAVATKAR